MRKLLSAFVLLTILFNSAGYYIVYEFDRYLIHREVASLLEHGCFDKALSSFSVFNPSADPAFRRIDTKEIVYHENLYDVVKEVPKGKIVTFYCIHDSKEEALIDGMKSMHQNKKAQNLLQHLVTIALPVTPSRSHPQETKNIVYPSFRVSLADHTEIPFSPPPEKS